MFRNKKSFFKKLGIFLAILGPGIITGSVDNDAGGITTYSVAAAVYGYNLIWTLIPSFIVLVVIQEMNARMGIAVHGDPHAETRVHAESFPVQVLEPQAGQPLP